MPTNPFVRIRAAQRGQHEQDAAYRESARLDAEARVVEDARAAGDHRWTVAEHDQPPHAADDGLFTAPGWRDLPVSEPAPDAADHSAEPAEHIDLEALEGAHCADDYLDTHHPGWDANRSDGHSLRDADDYWLPSAEFDKTREVNDTAEAAGAESWPWDNSPDNPANYPDGDHHNYPMPDYDASVPPQDGAAQQFHDDYSTSAQEHRADGLESRPEQIRENHDTAGTGSQDDDSAGSG
jgi:hypothetical protein